MATKKKTDPEKLGELHVDVIAAANPTDTIPFNVSLSTSGNMSTQTGIVALISSVGMIIEDTIRTAVQVEFADKLSDDERAELENVIILPLMDALGSQLGLIETSLDYTLKQIATGDVDHIKGIFASIESEVNDGESSE